MNEEAETVYLALELAHVVGDGDANMLQKGQEHVHAHLRVSYGNLNESRMRSKCICIAMARCSVST